MPSKVHQTAIISKGAILDGEDIEVGAFSYIGPNVVIGNSSKINSHCVIEGNTIIGKNNQFFPFSVIGSYPQHSKFSGGTSKLLIGDNNIIREHVTIHPGTEIGSKITSIGSNGLYMVGSHVAHDCVVGDNVIFVNGAVIGGHVEIGDYCYLGGHSAVHQFCRVGKHAIIGASTMVDGDVIPFSSVVGSRGRLSGLNLVGLKRRSFKREDIKMLRQVYRLLFAPEGTFTERLIEVKEVFGEKPLVDEILSFLNNNSHRSLVHPGAN